MNDFSELEAELKRLRPAAPSADLMARVERELSEAPVATATAGVLPRRPKMRMNWFSLGLGVAAAAAFLLLARVDIDRAQEQKPTIAAATPGLPASASEPARALLPDGFTRVVYNTRDEGLVFPRGSTDPLRRVRSHSQETLQWKNPGTGASLRVSYPTEEIELIPVSGQ